MDRLAKLVSAFALAFGSAGASAGYALATPPPAFSSVPGSPYNFAPGGNASNQAFGRVIYAPAGPSVNVAGRTVTMPAAYRLAANAPRIAAAAVFLNPWVRTAASIASWLGAAAITYNALSGKWETVEDGEVSTGFEYSFQLETGWHSSLNSAATARLAFVKQWDAANWTRTLNSCDTQANRCTFTVISPGNSPQVYEETAYVQAAQCPPGSVKTPAGCRLTQTREITTPEEMGDILNPKPMPDRVPLELPPNVPLPVEQPVINPEPGPNPVHRPLFVPTGDPVKNPNYDPQAQPSPANQPNIQPGVRLVPSPTPNEPWRIDHQPVDRPVASPEPSPEPVPEPVPQPGQDDPSSADKPKEDKSDLCKDNPDIVACAKMDDVEPEEVQNHQEQLSITPSAGWESGAATCPAPVTRQVAGLTLEMQWQPFCDLATGIRPVILALAWVAAAMMVIGVARRGD